MAKNRDEIQSHIANRKLTILKGFKEVSETPPVSLVSLQDEVGKENIFTLEILKGFADTVLEKGDVSDAINAQETINAMSAFKVIDERGIAQTVYIEKGKKAMIGETRDWKGKKYKKLANGKWQKVVETYTEDFVDEDTGEIVSIEREVGWKEKIENEPMAVPNKTRQRKQRNADAREAQVKEIRMDKQGELADLMENYKRAKQELKDIDSEMNQEAGQMGDRWNDAKANEYGGRMMKVEAEMEEMVPEIKALKVLIENLEEKEADIWMKSPEGLDTQYEDGNLTKAEMEQIEKGHMDFDSGSGGGGRQGLVKKQLTDKTGKQTTRWVRANEDEGAEQKEPKGEEEDNESLANRELESEEYTAHAEDTPSEQLAEWLQKNPDAPGANEARAVMEARGESDGVTKVELDYSDTEAVKEALANHEDKDAIMQYAIEHDISPSKAMKMHDGSKTDQSETHAALDAAHDVINDLKEKTGHPDHQGGTAEKLAEAFEDMIDEGEDGLISKLIDKLGDQGNEDGDYAYRDGMMDLANQLDEAGMLDEAFAEIDAYNGINAEDEDDEGDDDMYSPERKMEMLASNIVSNGELDDDLLLDFFDATMDLGGFDPSSERQFISVLEEVSNYMSMEEVTDLVTSEHPDADALIDQYWTEEMMNNSPEIDNDEKSQYRDEFEEEGDLSIGDSVVVRLRDGSTSNATILETDTGENEDGTTDGVQVKLENGDIEYVPSGEINPRTEKETETTGKYTAKENGMLVAKQEDDESDSLEEKGASKEFTPDALKTIESMGEHIWNRQGDEMDTPKLFEQYMGLKKEGYSEQDIETEMGKGQWDEGAMMSDEEKEGMKEEWDSALDAILGEDRKKDAYGDDSKKKDETTRKQNWTRSGNPIVDANADNDYYSDATAEDHDDIVEHYNEMHSGGNLPDLDARVKERVASHSEAAERKRKSK
jgi:uncharacterized protein YukE